MKIAIADTSLNHPTWQRKRWPYYPELSHRLVSLNHDVVLVGGEYEASKFDSRLWPKNILNCMGSYTIPETTSIINQCDIFVGNDSGLAHISAAIGIPTFVIFGATIPAKNTPMGNQVKVINLSLSCSPCQYTSRWTDCISYECMNKLSVERVLKEMEDVI